MSTIKIIAPRGGFLLGEQFVEDGQVVEVEEATARRLVAAEHALHVQPVSRPGPEGVPPPRTPENAARPARGQRAALKTSDPT